MDPALAATNISSAVQPMARAGHAITSFENNLYIFGDFTTNNEKYIEFDDTWQFDLNGLSYPSETAGH
ncbi:unnamed protein product [Phytophthora lilii]|uniref:Unnamed protein product n=1 Tax=Phytophthora lilii TaxID=2077276 RepID=A0A9W6WSG5_9STRA|nr:unnamed protein product [Phytophthora lilii]